METERLPFGRGCPVLLKDGRVLTLTSGPSANYEPIWTGIDRDGKLARVFDCHVVGPVRNCPPRLVYSDERAVATA